MEQGIKEKNFFFLPKVENIWKSILQFLLEMARFKKGQSGKRTNLWQIAGGRHYIIQCLISLGFSELDVTSDQWTALVLKLFETNDKNYLKWLKVILYANRRGIKTEVLNAGTVNFITYTFIVIKEKYFRCNKCKCAHQ